MVSVEAVGCARVRDLVDLVKSLNRNRTVSVEPTLLGSSHAPGDTVHDAEQDRLEYHRSDLATPEGVLRSDRPTSAARLDGTWIEIVGQRIQVSG